MFDSKGDHMVDIDKMTSDEWLAYRRQKVADFYDKGFELKPDPECSTCDVHNDYVCFDHELIQTGE
jgi:hypothetical protein